MPEEHIFDKWGFIIAASVLIFSTILFWSYTGTLYGSLAAAIIASGLVWATYIILRWVFLAAKR